MSLSNLQAIGRLQAQPPDPPAMAKLLQAARLNLADARVVQFSASNRFDAADFTTGQSDTQLFLTWELPIEDAYVARALQVRFDTDPAIASRLAEEQLWRNGAPAEVCPDSGQWRSQPICPEFVEELS